MGLQPPVWVSWVADIGSILGFAATVILAVQTARLRDKYVRLINLNKFSVELSIHIGELFRLAGNDVYPAAGAEVQQRVGLVIGFLERLGHHLKGQNQDRVQSILVSVNGSKSRVTQSVLIQMVQELSVLVSLLDDLIENAKLRM